MSSDDAQQRRFGGITRLYGEAAFQRFQSAHVCVIGVGGVGSWAAESLARSGIGELTLIDMDHVAESNINRQLAALDSTLGKAKVITLKERIADINPECRVTTVEDFISADNLEIYITNEMDHIVDCMDSFRVKAALIAYCRRRKINMVTVGGAGGKTDPTQIRLVDLGKTEHDPLLAKTRKELRQKYRFSRNLKRRFDIPAVFSAENITFQPGESCDINAGKASHLNCGGLGSVTHVTAAFGLVAVSRVLDRLARP